MNMPDKHLPLLVGNMLIAYIPHAFRLPSWVTSWFLFFCGFLFLSSLYRWKMPGKSVRYLLIVAGFIGIYLTYGHIIGAEASVGFLAVMTILKPFEVVSERDRIMTLFMTYFLVISSVLSSTSLFISLYMVLCVLLTTTVLIHVNQTRGILVRQLRLTSIIMLQAIPLTVILFFLFPRIQGSLWGLSRVPLSQSGFSDTLSPGDISYLIQSNETAFRVEFEGAVPSPDKMYWRGLVFLTFDGRTWRYGKRSIARRRPLEGNNPVEYTVILEPHNKHWLFALDLPDMAPPESILREDHTIYTHKSVRSRLRYSVRSLTTYDTGDLYSWELLTSSIPWGINPEAYYLARDWRSRTENVEELVNLARSYFVDNGFVYTLTPPLLGQHPVDDFLFRSRQGYCEHYASAFAFLMRAADVPARIVVGYLGGEYNPYGNFVIVRQSDAHAWVEIWSEGKGWLRVDPTGFVAPDRIRLGLLNALSAEDVQSYLQNPEYGHFANFFRKTGLSWDAVNNTWNIWVIDYTSFRQKQFLSFLGINTATWRGPLLFLLAMIGLAGVGIGLLLVRPWVHHERSGDKVRLSYDLFCRKLAKRGLPRHPAQGPADYARMVCRKRPDLASAVRHLSNLYITLRYKEKGDKKDAQRFHSMVRRFNPASSPPTHR